MSDIERVSPENVRENVRSDKAMLVCAYDDDDKYGKMNLAGSIALSTFKSKTTGIAKDKEIIFY